MTTKELRDLIEERLPDNDEGLISASDLRSVLHAMAENTDERITRIDFALSCLAATLAGFDAGAGSKELVFRDIFKFVAGSVQEAASEDDMIHLDLKSYPHLSAVAEHLRGD